MKNQRLKALDNSLSQAFSLKFHFPKNLIIFTTKSTQMHRLLFILLLFFALSASAKEGISVKSFRCLPKDMDARIDHPVTDQNGDVAALIKVVTTETGFKFEAGSLGVVKTEQKTSEIWVYVPYGSRKITIKHPELGVLRNYVYPEAIKKATVYEMVLTTGKVVTTVEEPVYSSQWLIIKSTPDKANVFIDDKLAGTTPFYRKYKEGEYNYRIEKSRYHNQAGKLNLSGEKKTLEFDLKPKFGNIRITSAPEKGMRIYLDDENTGKTTPATLEEVSSGEHRMKLQSQWYQSKAKIVSVEDEQTATLDFTMQPAFAELSVTAKPGADILIDGDKKATGSWSGRLLGGIYTVKAEKDKYYSDEEQVEITAGKDENLSFDLKGKTGSVDVVTTPMDAKVYLDGEKQGTSPLTIKDKLIGSYDIRLEKAGYGTVSQSIQIKEDETITVEETLPQGKEVTISSTPSGASLSIDGEAKGTTPYTGTISFGSHNIKLVNGEKVVEESISVTQSGKSRWEFDVQEFGDFTEKDAGVNIDMVAVKGGTFKMGCTSGQSDCDDDEKPVHSVTVDDFYIGKYEVTQAQWKAIMGSNPSHFDDCGSNCPVKKVSWKKVQEFIKKLNQKTGKNYRLPTEAEWEYAARGGSKSKGYKYAGSNSIGTVAWYNDNSGSETHPVGQKQPNELGLYDMSGNVYEWCSDWYGDYSSSSQTNPKGPSSGSNRVLRGGSWYYNARYCRVASRDSRIPNFSDYNRFGFRLVLPR
jgi:formylglycine-generating enzyme required for sulfatase activity